MNRCVLPALLFGVALCSAVKSVGAAESDGNRWNAFQADTRALGGRCISNNANAHKPPAAGDTERIAAYSVTFPATGTYDLYVRIAEGTMYFSKQLGEDYAWQEVKKLDIPEGEYGWVNLSERFADKKTGDLTYTVDAPSTQSLGIAGRTRGTRIDAFVFGPAERTFTAEQLTAAAQGADASRLIGFQAEHAVTFGSDTLTDAGRTLRAKYARILATARAEISQHTPQVEPAKQAALRTALAAQKLAEAIYDQEYRAWRRGYLNKVTGLKSAQERLADAPSKLADAQAVLANALAMPVGHADKADAVAEAQRNVEKRQEDLQELPEKLAKAEAAFESAQRSEPELTKRREAAAAALARATWCCNATSRSRYGAGRRRERRSACNSATKRRRQRFNLQRPFKCSATKKNTQASAAGKSRSLRGRRVASRSGSWRPPERTR